MVFEKIQPEKKYKEEPEIIRFLSENKEIEIYISLISIAELVHTLKYHEEFQRYKISLGWIKELIQEFQNIVGFNIIINERINNIEIGGIIIIPEILEFLDKHNGLADCIHVDIAKRNDLCFITYEKKIGRLKEFYDNIITESKLMKQF